MLNLAPYKRIVVKIGSSLLVRADVAALRLEWLMLMAADIAALRESGHEVVVVTSGAVAAGRQALGIGGRRLELAEKQAVAAIGQPLLMAEWARALARHNLVSAQVLLTLEDSDARRRFLNARTTFSELLRMGVLPLVNENDTVATGELRVGDNDRLAARVAQMVGADLLVILSDVDGLFTANPQADPSAVLVPRVEGSVTPEIAAMAGGAGAIGSGGMATKLEAARIALASGCDMAIAPGHGDHPLNRLQAGGPHTHFIASETARSSRKHWILGQLQPAGQLWVDDGAAAALAKGASLLPAGVTRVDGNFEKGDAVQVMAQGGRLIAVGLVGYDAQDARTLMGCKSDRIEACLGYAGRPTLVHRDDMVLAR